MGGATPVNRKAAETLPHSLVYGTRKKAAPKGAAKFREETPRKGHGMAIKDRDAALQQYARTKPKSQALIFSKSQKHQYFLIPN
jgi:hypothetical protein